MYSISKTLQKTSLPITTLILVNIAIAIAKAKGIVIDESIIWQAAIGGTASIQGLINWLKNRKKK